MRELVTDIIEVIAFLTLSVAGGLAAAQSWSWSAGMGASGAGLLVSSTAIALLG